MKDVSIRAARLHQTRPLLCPEKASLYQEKSPRSWASGPAPGDSGAERGAGGPRPACVHRGWRGRASACTVGGRGSAPSTRCRLWWGPPPAERLSLRRVGSSSGQHPRGSACPSRSPQSRESLPRGLSSRRHAGPETEDGGRRGRGSAAPACARRRGTVLPPRVASRLCWPMSPPPGRSSPTPTQRQSSADAHVVLQATAGAFPTAPPVGRPRARIAVCSSWAWPTHPTVLPAASPGAST